MNLSEQEREREVGSGGWMDGWWVRGEMEAERREGEVLMNGLMAHWPTNVASALPVALPGLVKHTRTGSDTSTCKLISPFDRTFYPFTPQQGIFLDKDSKITCASWAFPLLHFWVCTAELITETAHEHTSANTADWLLLKVIKWRKQCSARTGNIHQVSQLFPPLGF